MQTGAAMRYKKGAKDSLVACLHVSARASMDSTRWN